MDIILVSKFSYVIDIVRLFKHFCTYEPFSRSTNSCFSLDVKSCTPWILYRQHQHTVWINFHPVECQVLRCSVSIKFKQPSVAARKPRDFANCSDGEAESAVITWVRSKALTQMTHDALFGTIFSLLVTVSIRKSNLIMQRVVPVHADAG